MRQPAVGENFIQVALIDDHAILRQALKNAFHYHGRIRVGIEASNYPELLDKLSTSRIEIIIMDLTMPDLTKTQTTIHQIQQLIPEAKILILTMHNEESIKQELIKCGIFSFISKGADFEQLIESILMAAEGATGGIKSAIFSEREKMILKLIAAGKTNVEISRVVFLSVRSIEQIRHKMKDRANVTNTASLIDFAIRNRMID